jgi:hypothetical protein
LHHSRLILEVGDHPPRKRRVGVGERDPVRARDDPGIAVELGKHLGIAAEELPGLGQAVGLVPELVAGDLRVAVERSLDRLPFSLGDVPLEEHEDVPVPVDRRG